MTQTVTPPALSSMQTIQLMHAIDHQLYQLIGDCLPDSTTLSPIRTQGELERRRRCHDWARELVEGAAYLGITNTTWGLDYVNALDLADRFIRSARALHDLGCLPEEEPQAVEDAHRLMKIGQIVRGLA